MDDQQATFKWAAHTHVFTLRTYSSGCYHSVEDEVCMICDQAAGQSGMPKKEHFKHPKGCHCYWCVFCRCAKLYERENAEAAG